MVWSLGTRGDRGKCLAEDSKQASRAMKRISTQVHGDDLTSRRHNIVPGKR